MSDDDMVFVEFNVRFMPGRILLTDGVIAFITPEDPDQREHPDYDKTMFLSRCLTRHVSGDWGDLDAHDRHVNRQAMESGARLLSSYVHEQDGERTRIWIITDAAMGDDPRVRQVTTVLLPSEY